MSYLVLARKYRPQSFDELVGQEHVVRTLVNALEAKRVGHAYIFSGPRGCGKTTTARLLAKALNCEKGPTPTSCNACAACKEIAEGASADDVLEIDGASNRGIDQIRELRDTVKYAPARGRYRIVIIDEAHQITDAGFNALLKTLEEPPPHAVFMMATTESQKIPSTILSRCQRFQLKSIPTADTVKQLKEILAAEKVKAEDEALFEVARAAHGGLRDALSLLDQVISYSPEGVTTGGIRDLLGLLPREKVRAFAAVLREGAPEKVLQAVQKAVDEGFELGQLAQNLLDHFHEILLWKNGVRADAGDPAALEKEAAFYEGEDAERAVAVLAQAMDRLRRSESPRVAFELACLDLSRKALPVDELLDRLEALEARLSGNGAAPPAPLVKKKSELDVPPRAEPFQAAAFSSPPHNGESRNPPLETASAAAPRPLEPGLQREAALPPALTVTAESVRRGWPRVLEAAGAKKPALEPFLAAARPELSPEGTLRLLCRDDFQRSQIAGQLAMLTGLVQKEIGPAPVSCAVSAAPPASPPPPPAPRSAAPMEDAEEASDDGDMPPEEEDAAAPPAAAEEAAASATADVDAGEMASLEPGLKKVLDRFPGKLKKLDALP